MLIKAVLLLGCRLFWGSGANKANEANGANGANETNRANGANGSNEADWTNGSKGVLRLYN